MDIDDLLAPDGIVLRSGASSKREALRVIADAAAVSLDLHEGRVLDALLEREALGSTGLGNGVAIPHARIEGLTRICGVFFRLETPVAYGSVDDRPVDLLFALFAPPAAGAEHLRALAAVSRALRSSELREKLRQAHTVDAVHALFVRNEAATAA
jgi:PTS system nitrogen regulatory IIA component